MGAHRGLSSLAERLAEPLWGRDPGDGVGEGRGQRREGPRAFVFYRVTREPAHIGERSGENRATRVLISVIT